MSFKNGKKETTHNDKAHKADKSIITISFDILMKHF